MIPPSRSGLTLRRNRNKPLRGRQYLTRLMRLGARAKTDLPKPQHIAVSIGLGVDNAMTCAWAMPTPKRLVLVNATPSLRPTLAALRCYRLANVCALNVGLRKSKGLGFAKHNHCEGGQTQ